MSSPENEEAGYAHYNAVHSSMCGQAHLFLMGSVRETSMIFGAKGFSGTKY
jgi:hypothetical protein